MMLPHPFLVFSIMLKILGVAMEQEKEIKGTQIERKEIK